MKIFVQWRNMTFSRGMSDHKIPQYEVMETLSTNYY